MANRKTDILKLTLATDLNTLFTEWITILNNNTEIVDGEVGNIRNAIAGASQQIQDIITNLLNYYTKTEIDTNFYTKANVYAKTETYTKEEIDELIGSIARLEIKVVDTIEDVTEAGYIYLVQKEFADQEDIFDEYIFYNNKPELIGTTQIDLSNYYTKDEVDDLLSEIRDLFKVESMLVLNNTTFIENNLAKLKECYKLLIESQNMTFYKTCLPTPYLTDEGILLDIGGFLLQDSLTFICDLGTIKYILKINEDTFSTTLTTITV